MKYVWGFIWVFLLVHMVTYVAGSMLAVPYNFTTASTLGSAAAILVIIVAAIIPDKLPGNQA